jgi:PAS domain-containing protein
MGIGLSRGNQVVFASPALLRMFGYDDLEEFAKIPLLDHTAPASVTKSPPG